MAIYQSNTQFIGKKKSVYFFLEFIYFLFCFKYALLCNLNKLADILRKYTASQQERF